MWGIRHSCANCSTPAKTQIISARNDLSKENSPTAGVKVILLCLNAYKTNQAG